MSKVNINPSFFCSRCGSLDFVSVGKCRKCKTCGKYITWTRKKEQKGWRQWNKGLTKEDPRVAKYGSRCSTTKRGFPKYREIALINAEKSRKLLVSKEVIEDMYWKQNMTQFQIAKKLNVSQSLINSFMKRNGISNRGREEGLRRRTEEIKKEVYVKVSRAMKGNTNWRFSHQYPNSEEKKMIRFLNKWILPFKYVGDGSFKIDGKCPDFIYEEKNLIIEFFGELWHEKTDEQKRVDFFKQLGWNCLVIWGRDLGSYLKDNKTYAWEHRLYDKIIRWMAGII